MIELRPLRLGELLDRSISFWRAHWKPLFRLGVGFQLVQFMLIKAAVLVSQQQLPGLGPELAERLKGDPSSTLRLLGKGGALLFGVAFTALYVSQLAGSATTMYAYPRLLGRDGGPSVGAAVRGSLARGGVALGAYLLSLAWSALVGLGFLLPGGALTGAAALTGARSPRAAVALLVLGGLGLALGLIALVLWSIMRFLLTAQVVALEDGGPARVFRRTGELSSGRVGDGVEGVVKLRLTALITVIGLVLLVVGVVASFPTLALGAAYGADYRPGRTANDLVPQFLLVPAELVEVLLGSLVAPLYATFQLVFYVDMRVRREGLDLELKLAA
jgi:hypothetical protein